MNKQETADQIAAEAAARQWFANCHEPEEEKEDGIRRLTAIIEKAIKDRVTKRRGKFLLSEYIEIHRAWLVEAGEAFITGKPMPPPRARTPISEPICEQCRKNLATCKGEYETCTGIDHYACDACCGHGNEDGHCEPIRSQIPATASEQDDTKRLEAAQEFEAIDADMRKDK